jgi:nicotinate-nucleotide adenylyltransferase
MSPAARVYAPYRIDGQARHLLGRAQAPAWCFVNVPMVNLSSTDLRNRGIWANGVLPE